MLCEAEQASQRSQEYCGVTDTTDIHLLHTAALSLNRDTGDVGEGPVLVLTIGHFFISPQQLLEVAMHGRSAAFLRRGFLFQIN